MIEDIIEPEINDFNISKKDLEKCFFKGRVSKVLPGIQTAFVDIGEKKAGFLHISEIDKALAIEKTAEFMQVDDTKERESIERKIKSAISITNKKYTISLESITPLEIFLKW